MSSIHEHDSAMRRVAVGGVVGLLLAVIGISVAVFLARAALQMNLEVHDRQVFRPIETSVDFSRPGETTAPFRQTCEISHGELLVLECDLDQASSRNVAKLLDGLYADFAVKRSDGTEVEAIKLNIETVQYLDGDIMLANFPVDPKGDYIATLRVESGAPALAGREQKLVAKYALCGLEELPVELVSAFAIGAGALGLVAAVCVLPGLLKRGFWREPKLDSAAVTPSQ